MWQIDWIYLYLTVCIRLGRRFLGEPLMAAVNEKVELLHNVFCPEYKKFKTKA
jgi:hypothetical protein